MSPQQSNTDEMIRYTKELHAREKNINYVEYLKNEKGQSTYRELLTACASALNQRFNPTKDILYKDDFDMLMKLIATLLREKIDIPEKITIFLAECLEQKYSPPTTRRPKEHINFSDEHYYFLAHELNKKFGIPLYTAENTAKISAAEIIAEAMHKSIETIKKSIKKTKSHIRKN